MIEHYNCGLQRYAIETRMATKDVFKELYGTDRLWCSFEGTSFSRPPQRYANPSLAAWHERRWDEPLVVTQTGEGSPLFQGAVSLTTQQEKDHVFVFVKGSHHHHGSLLAKGNEARRRVNLEVLSEQQKAFLRDEKALDVVRVPLKAGSLVLWDCRTAHGTASYCKDGAADDTTARVVVHVSMEVAADGNAVQRQKRARCYEEGLVTGHCTGDLQWFSKKANTRGRRMAGFVTPPSDGDMSEEEKRLHGLLRY
jgi:hypothetical protein